MKKRLLFIVSAGMFLTSCGGGSEETGSNSSEGSTEETTISEVDSSEIENSPEAFSDFATFVEEQQVNSDQVELLFSKYEELRGGFSQEEKDSSFWLIHDFMNRFELSENLNWNDLDSLKKHYDGTAFFVGSDEGFLWISVDKYKLSQRFGDDLSEELLAYCEIGKVESVKCMDDASLVISWQEYGDLVFQLEDLLIKNADSKYYQDFFNSYTSYLRLLLWGVDNSPIKSWDDENSLMPEVEANWDRMIADESHKTGRILEEHKRRLEENGFVIDYQNMSWPSEDTITEYLGLI